MNGIQAWVALPKEDEETDPSFVHCGSEHLPVLEERGLRVRLIAGRAYGLEASVTTHSPLFYAHCELDAGARAPMPGGYLERAVYVVAGAVDVGGQSVNEGFMAVMRRDVAVELAAVAPSTVMLLGGEPIGDRFIEWNFVSSSQERIEQAKADWRAGRMKLPDGDSDERIPLPGDAAPANPMS
jgi:redox-sensitive bicupin YhaK (pirin superfamily)